MRIKSLVHVHRFALLSLIAASLVGSSHAQTLDLYASDVTSGDVLRFTADGSQSSFATVGAPRGLAFDTSGNLYVADGVAFAIIKITPAGAQSTFASRLNDPRGIAFDAAGNLFVCNSGNNEILKFTPDGVQSTFVSGLNRPADIVFDEAGNLFESDRLSGSLLKITPDGTLTTFATGLNLPAGLAFNSAGELFAVEQGTASVLKFTADGTSSVFAALDPADFPIRVTLDDADHLFLSDVLAAGGGVIYEFTPAGVRSTFATLAATIGFLLIQPEVTTPPPPATGQLLNISTRLNVLPGDNVLIGGFIIGGNDPKQVIVRVTGPALGDFGISNFLANPTLELHAPDGSVISNDNWMETQKNAIAATGLAPAKALEPAILATLTPGAYTAIVRGVNDTSGIALVEIYDLDSTGDSRLVNISTRGFIDTGNNVMIGGLIIGPDDRGDATVLVRAIGPSLGALGVSNALQDPVLELHGSNGDTITTNDNWRDTQEAEITATGLKPKNDAESATLQTLAPGNYTAIVRGADDTTGVGLVEVYQLD